MDNRESVTNGRGLTTTYAYDLFNRLVQTVEPGDATTSYNHDSQGNLTSMIDPEGRETTFVYDDRANVLRTTSPDSGSTLNFYDQTGRLQSTTDANGTTINFAADTLGRRTLIDYPNDPDVTLQYDQGENGKGRLTSMIDGAASTTYLYDAQGRLTLQEAVISGHSYVTGYHYDRADNLTAMTYPGGRQFNYYPDTLGRVTRLATEVDGEAVNLAENINYVPFGPLTAMTYGNGLTLSRQFNEDLELTALQAGAALDRTYSHYPEGLVDTITDNLTSDNSQDFLYDDLNRLSLAQGNYGFFTYTLDQTGNRLTLDQDGTASTYGYEPATSRLTSVTGGQNITFSLDSHGSVIARNDRVFIYNDANRLIRVETDTGEVVAEYAYNGLGQRVSKTVAGNTIVFQYDQTGNLILEESISDGIRKEYLSLNNKRLAMIVSGESPCSAELDNDGDVDGYDLVLFAGSAGDLSELASQFGRSDCLQPGEDVFWYHTDHLDTPLLMTDQTGTIVWSAGYAPFGKATVEVESVVNNLRFPGQYFDVETGLYYNWHRYYDPQTGRYITVDPIGLRGGINLYAYVGGNPNFRTDRRGLAPGDVCTNITIKRRNIQLNGDDKYGHWWTEIGDNESYGWWPKSPVGLKDTLTGVPGELNGQTNFGGTLTQDPHHGEDISAGVDEIFHPVISSAPGCECMSCEDAARIARKFATYVYSGDWSWPTGQNCHSFQNSLMDAACLEVPQKMDLPLSP